MHKWFEGTVTAIGDGLIVARDDNGRTHAFRTEDGAGDEDLEVGDSFTVWLVEDTEVN